MRYDAVTIGLVALGLAWAGYSKTAAAKTPGAATPMPVAPTGVPHVDEIVIVGIRREADIIARTLYGEARGEGYQGMQAVGNVINNRFKISALTPNRRDWWGETFEQICMAPAQFEAWTLGNPNRDAAMRATPNETAFRQAQEIALRVINDTLPDITRGATHYHAKFRRNPTTGQSEPMPKPRWTTGATMTAAVKDHLFYAGVA